MNVSNFASKSHKKDMEEVTWRLFQNFGKIFFQVQIILFLAEAWEQKSRTLCQGKYVMGRKYPFGCDLQGFAETDSVLSTSLLIKHVESKSKFTKFR